MGYSAKRGAYSQSKCSKFSFNMTPNVEQELIDIHALMQAQDGQALTKTEVLHRIIKNEWRRLQKRLDT